MIYLIVIQVRLLQDFQLTKRTRALHTIPEHKQIAVMPYKNAFKLYFVLCYLRSLPLPPVNYLMALNLTNAEFSGTGCQFVCDIENRPGDEILAYCWAFFNEKF